MVWLDPKNTDAWDAMGLALGSKKEENMSKKCFDVSKKLKQHEIALIMDRAKISNAEAEYDESLRSLHRATDLDPKIVMHGITKD